MADFDIQDPKVFSEKLRKFEVTDKAHADLFNAVVEVLINNDAFLKAVADDYSKRHKTDKTIHVSAKERENWNEKAGKNTATQTENGLLSAEDKKKLDGIATGANKYTHPTTDGNMHVPPTGTTNDGKMLMAGSTSGKFSWQHPDFTQASSRANLTSGEKLTVSLGKIMKFFADVISKNIAFMTVVNNGTTTVANTLLDGRMGKTLLDKINSLNSALSGKVQKSDMVWSAWQSLGSAIGIEMNYRYNSYFVEIAYWGTLKSGMGITGQTIGYSFKGLPSNMKPSSNIRVPITANSSKSMCMQLYPNDTNAFSITSMDTITTKTEYLCGRFTYGRS